VYQGRCFRAAMAAATAGLSKLDMMVAPHTFPCPNAG
jgi:hypothetical protein